MWVGVKSLKLVFQGKSCDRDVCLDQEVFPKMTCNRAEISQDFKETKARGVLFGFICIGPPLSLTQCITLNNNSSMLLSLLLGPSKSKGVGHFEKDIHAVVCEIF